MLGAVFTGAMALLCAANATSAVDTTQPAPFHVILVDKNRSQIHLADYGSDHIEIRKTFHVTLGKNQGDKEVENDLKTPEGIYFFTSRMQGPTLGKKFGHMALAMNYPNPIDQLAGKTGYSIMLHATDFPARLLRDRDSEGCVVVSNEQIAEFARNIRIGLTPIIIYPELKDEYLRAAGNPEVGQAFRRWLEAWSGKDIDGYIGSYADGFRYNGMDLKRYREYKDSLNRKYSLIKIEAGHIRFYYHPKYHVVSFTQRYESTLKGGGHGFKSTGTKFLYFVKEGGQYKIADESYASVNED